MLSTISAKICKGVVLVVGSRLTYVRWFYVLGSLVCLSSGASKGQEYIGSIRKLTVRDGLSSSITWKVLQDPRGLIWVVTSQGLDRFDGYRFEKVLPNKTVTDICLIGDSVVAIAADGLYYYQLDTDVISKDPIFESRSIDRVITLDEGSIGLFSEMRYLCYDPKEEKVDTLLDYRDYPMANTAPPRHILFDTSNVHWLSVDFDGIFQIDSTGKVSRHYLDYEAGAMMLDSKGSIWVSGKYVSLYRLEQDRFRLFGQDRQLAHYRYRSRSKNSFWNLGTDRFEGDSVPLFHKILEIPDGGYWLTSHIDGHLYYWDGTSDTVLDFELDQLGIAFPNDLFLDRNGVVWLSTNKGLLLIQLLENPFSRHLDGETMGYAGLSTRGMAEVDSLVYISSYSGMRTLNLVTKEENWFVAREKAHGKVVPNPLNRCYDLEFDPNRNCLWCASESFGLMANQFDEDFLAHYHEVELKDHLTWMLLKSMDIRDTVILLGGVGILMKVNASDPFLNKGSNMDILPVDTFVCHDIRSSVSGSVWVATDQGLFELGPSLDTVFRQYTTESTSPELHFGGKCWVVHEDQDGTIWAGTADGLLRIGTDSKLRMFNQANANFPNNNICSIEPEGDSILWLGSFNGLMRFEKYTYRLRSFFEEDGLVANEFNHNSSLVTRDGTYLFGGINGVVSFDPKQLAKPMARRDLVLVHAEVFDTWRHEPKDITSSIRVNRQMVFSPSDVMLTLTCAIPDFISPEYQQYAYRLVGLDERWSYIKGNNQIRINRPPAGAYTLEIIASGSNGIWTQTPFAVKIQSLPPFYERPWFWILLAALVLASTYGIVTIRTRNLKQTKQKLERTVRERTREISQQKQELEALNNTKDRLFTILGHDLKAPIQSLKSLINLMRKGRLSGESLEAFSVELSNKLENLHFTLDNLLSWAYSQLSGLSAIKKDTDLFRLGKESIDALEQLARDKDIQLLNEVPDGTWAYADTDHIRLVVLNLLNNALKFTKANGTVAIAAMVANDEVTVSVRDTGVGIQKEALDKLFNRALAKSTKGTKGEKGTGLGLMLCQDFVELNGGRIWAVSEAGQGTVFHFTIPASGSTGPS